MFALIRNPSFRRFCQNKSGTVAVTVALGLVPMLLAVGVAVDYTRGQQFKSALQSAVDAAALAGASAYIDANSASTATTIATNNMTASIGHLPDHSGNVTFTATPSSGANAYNMTVTASATMADTLMSMVQNSVTITASAQAANPNTTVANACSCSNCCNSIAWDQNIVYWYIVPSDGSLPTLDPTHVVYSNAPGWNLSQSSAPVAQSSQKIGFALHNVTGGNRSYGNNGYNASPGSVHVLYSHISPPHKYAADPTDKNKETYNQQTQNCALEVVPGNPTNPPQHGGCFAGLPAHSAPSCAELAGSQMKFFWNDMGASTDDFDYLNAMTMVTCQPSGGGGGSTAVRLTQ